VGGPAFDPADPQSTGAAIYFDPFSDANIGDAIARVFALSAEARSRLRRNVLACHGKHMHDHWIMKVTPKIRYKIESTTCFYKTTHLQYYVDIFELEQVTGARLQENTKRTNRL